MNEDIPHFGNLELLARQVVEGFITGLHKSPFHGFSVEFAEHRLYNTGESVRNIDWKLYGRTDKLFVKRFEEETNLRCQLLLDVSSSMYYPQKNFNKLNFAVEATAALIYLFKKQRDAFGLSYFSNRIEFASPAKSTTVHQKYLFTELEKLLNRDATGKPTDIANALHQTAEQLHKRSLVIIFSDLLEGIEISGGDLNAVFSALQHLKYNKHEVVIFNVLDHSKELYFEFDNRPHHFIDIESGLELKVHPNQVKAHYLQQVQAYHKEFQLRCMQYKIDLIDADIQAGYHPVLQAYLIKRNKMVS